jgi:acetyl-CoA synthetase
VYWILVDNWTFVHSLRSLLNGATTVIFEGVLLSRLQWEVIVKHKVTQYTAPTAIRALAKESLDYVQKYKLDT